MPTSRQTLSTLSMKPFKALVFAASVVAVTLTVSPAIAQTAAQTTAQNPDMSATAAKGGALVRGDAKMLGDLLQGNRAEVQAGQLALEKSQDAEVKKFAQTMIDDHGKAITEIEALALKKQNKMPEGIGAKHKTKEVALKALSGDTFNSQYVKRAGLGDHEATIKLLKKIQKDGKDPELKALADKMLPTVQHHLEMAQQLAPKKA
jgi:putative membrane protein